MQCDYAWDNHSRIPVGLKLKHGAHIVDCELNPNYDTQKKINILLLYCRPKHTHMIHVWHMFAHLPFKKINHYCRQIYIDKYTIPGSYGIHAT